MNPPRSWALVVALLAGCSSPASPKPAGLCQAAGFAADRPFVGWSDGASASLLFSDGEVRQVQPIATPSGGGLRLQAGRDGWSVATLVSSDASDETSQVAILRPDGSTLWLGRIETTYPDVFAGPHGSVISLRGQLIFIDQSGNATEREEQGYLRALGGVGAAGEVLASWEERTDDGSLLDHPAFFQSTSPRTDLPAVLRGRGILVGESFHYVQAADGDLVWYRDGLGAHQTVLRVPNTSDGGLTHHGAWVVLSAHGFPIAVAREDGSDARLVPAPLASLPAYNTSANGNWMVGSGELGEPIWRLNMQAATLEDLSSTGFGTRRIFDASFCTPPLVTDARGRMLLGLRDDALGGLFREVSDQTGAWEALGRPVRGVIYISVRSWGDTVVASAETGENTFCRDRFGQWPDLTDNTSVLEGASVQIFHPDAEPRLLAAELLMHPSGSCVVLRTPGVGAEILEVATGATLAIPATGLPPVWLQ